MSKAAKSKQVTPTKNKRTNKASPSTVTDVIERVDDSSIDNLSIVQLKAELKAIGLSPVGSKIDLVERLKEGVLEYNPDPDGEKHYDYDPTNPLKKKYFLEIAPSSRSHCVRCYNIINQGTLRLGFDSWDVENNHAVSRYYHYRCFAASPPPEIESVNDLQFIQRRTRKYDKATKTSVTSPPRADTSTPQMIQMFEEAFINV